MMEVYVEVSFKGLVCTCVRYMCTSLAQNRAWSWCSWPFLVSPNITLPPCFCFVLNAWIQKIPFKKFKSTENSLTNYIPCVDLYHLPSPHSQQLMALLESHIQISNTGGDQPLSHLQQEGRHREERKLYRGCRSGEARPMSRQGALTSGHNLRSMWYRLAGVGAGSNFGWGQWWPSGFSTRIRDSGVLQPRPWGWAENGTCGCSRWTVMTAKESSKAIWRPCQPEGEAWGLGFHRSPAPGSGPRTVVIVTPKLLQSPFSSWEK